MGLLPLLAGPAEAGEWVRCTDSPVDEGLRCARLSVPENPDDPQGRRIELSIVVVSAASPLDAAVPLFALAGGPGGSVTGDAEFFLGEGSGYRAQRDVVLVDQRGTGGSAPLHCPRLEGRGVPWQRHLDEMYPLDEVRECRDRLALGADLTQYSTANAVRDLEAVRAFLGSAQIDLFGISYGTRLAVEYLRRHPDRVRSVALVGPLALDNRMPLRHAEHFQRAFDFLLEDCERDDECHETFPHLGEEWRELLRRLGSGPARAAFSPPGEAAPVELRVGRDALVTHLRAAMYTASGARRVPRVIHAAASGDFEPFLELALPETADGPPGLAEGTYLSVTCTDDASRITAEEVEANGVGTDLGASRAKQQWRACSLWPRGSLATGFGEPLESLAPALLVVGERDPVTPPSEALSLARSFRRGRVLRVPHAGHLPYDLDDPMCVDRVAIEFFERQSADDLDTSCLTALTAPPFALEASPPARP